MEKCELYGYAERDHGQLRTVHIDKAYRDKNKDIIGKTVIATQATTTTGAPVLDGYNHLLGIRSEDGKDISLDTLLKYFESVFKYKIQYQ